MASSAPTAPQNVISADTSRAGPTPCTSCGACCEYDRTWPRLSLETEAEIARVPAVLLDEPRGRMRTTGERCAALLGTVGKSVRCGIYRVRLHVCRACQPGDDACNEARIAHGLAPLPSSD